MTLRQQLVVLWANGARLQLTQADRSFWALISRFCRIGCDVSTAGAQWLIERSNDGHVGADLVRRQVSVPVIQLVEIGAVLSLAQVAFYLLPHS